MKINIKRVDTGSLLEYKQILDTYNADYFEHGKRKYAEIEINSLEDLFSLSKKLDESLIIDTYQQNQVIIYDDYIE